MSGMVLFMEDVVLSFGFWVLGAFHFCIWMEGGGKGGRGLWCFST